MPALQPPVAPPIPTREPVTGDNGLMSRAWIYWFTFLGKQFGFNQFIEADGTPVPQELALNFLPPFTVTDNPDNTSTDIGLAAFTQVDVTADRALGTNYTTPIGIGVSAQARQTASSGGDNSIQGLSNGAKVGGNTTTSTIPGAVLSSFFLVPAGGTYSVAVTPLSGSSTWIVDSWIEWPI